MEATARIYLAQADGSDRRRSVPKRLADVIESLEAIAGELLAQDQLEEAGSITTVVADLLWQIEEIARHRRVG